MPVPVSAMLSGKVAELLGIVTEPLLMPLESGEKVISNVQVWLVVMLFPLHVSLLSNAKSPETVMVSKIKSTASSFVMVTVCGELVVPTN